MSGYWRLLLLVFLGFGSCVAPAPMKDIEGKAVSKVTIRYKGPKTVDEIRVRKHIGTTEGSVYKSDQVDNDIKSLYGSGLVNDVRVLAAPRRKGLEVIFEVQAQGVIGPGPGFVGNTVFSDQRLAKATGVRAGQVINGETLSMAARRVEAYYHSHGYPEAKVTSRTQPAEDGSVDFIFIVEEGPHTAE